MPEVVLDTSPLQYLFQLGLLQLLPALYTEACVPIGVVQELAAGLERGVNLPTIAACGWLHVVKAPGSPTLALAPDLGVGEREALALALSIPGSLVVLDDALARRFARRLNLALTGTFGILLKAKQRALVGSIGPILDHLDKLNFRLDLETRRAVLEIAKE